jgi:DNA adenine methylase
MILPKAERKNSYTPLRYPGGKTSLYSFFDQLIQGNKWSNLTYIEPYAGGAGAALALLFTEKVESIVINDYDPAIYSFWYSVVYNTQAFIERLKTTSLSVAEWRKQKEIYRAADIGDTLSLGFATFYLNRTNHSGVLNAGPIGGIKQTGIWKIDARYNKESLIRKIELIGGARDQITVTHKDGVEVIKEYAALDASFFYIDPPYFVKGAYLYLNAFSDKHHEELAAALNEVPASKWLLSYDNEPEILALYSQRNSRPFDLRYSVSHSTKSGSELMIFSDAIDMQIVDDLY